MAQKVLVSLVDDIDGSAATETIQFELDGVSYEIDLSEDNAVDFRDSLAQYIEYARVTKGGKRAAPRPAAPAPAASSDREESQAIRAWARENGFEISDRGRIPNDVVDAYQQAKSKKKKK